MSQAPRSEPHSTFYDGWFYASVVESMMRGLHRLAARPIPDDVRVLDACCGTGGLAMMLAGRCREVVGVDLSPRQIRQARRTARRRGVDNVTFDVGDAAHLDQFERRTFDFATLVMAVHEMPPAVRPGIIAELLRVAEKLVLVDFHAPMRWNPAGIRNRFMELAAGVRHFRYFRDFSSNGGLRPLLRKAKARILDERITDRGNVAIYQVSAQTE